MRLPRFLLFSARQGAFLGFVPLSLQSPVLFSSSGIALLFTSAYLVFTSQSPITPSLCSPQS